MSKSISRLAYKPLIQSTLIRPSFLSRSFTTVPSQRLPDPTPSTPAPTRTPTPTPTPMSRDKKANLDLLSSIRDTFTFRQPHTIPTGPSSGEPFHLHCYTTKHNTHVTLTNPQRNALISISCGNLGFRKGARGTYEAAFQTSAWVMRKMQEKGLFEEGNENYVYKLEVVLRGFGEGRQAFTQALMGIEGRLIRPRVSRVSDATRIKFGGARSPNPRRLG